MDASGYTVYNGRQYMIFSDFQTSSGAQAVCAGESPSASLLEIDSQDEYDFVFTWTRFTSPASVLWMGYSYDGSDMTRFSDGSTLAPSDFGGDFSGGVAPWDASEPNSAPSCVAFVVNEDGQNKGKYRDISCTASRYYVCERADFTTTTSTTTTSTTTTTTSTSTTTTTTTTVGSPLCISPRSASLPVSYV